MAIPPRPVSVECLPVYSLRVRFEDGLVGTVRMAKLIASSRAGVFASLRDADLFRQVHISDGAVAWPDDIDLAPDAMYDKIRASGSWTLA